ncbi:threonine dehydratase biosynthetic, chloroplastic [Tanacetum coccineum]|uniref:Threonine dehydratase biosynthetic, chloroplastic n=1 Tax=Tanacetum coccineum TaxID=301880 RepID=A0ABQ4X7A9_9ASTR
MESILRTLSFMALVLFNVLNFFNERNCPHIWKGYCVENLVQLLGDQNLFRTGLEVVEVAFKDIEDMFEEKKSILEPAGALALAGAEAYCKFYNLKDINVVAITSGANMNFDRLRLVTELANVGRQQEAMLATFMPESPASFKQFGELEGDQSISIDGHEAVPVCQNALKDVIEFLTSPNNPDGALVCPSLLSTEHETISKGMSKSIPAPLVATAISSLAAISMAFNANSELSHILDERNRRLLFGHSESSTRLRMSGTTAAHTDEAAPSNGSPSVGQNGERTSCVQNEVRSCLS